MNIGQAAAASGVSAKMIRYYESVGLVPKAGRNGNGYRDYDADDVNRLRFVRRARELGFSMDRIRELLGLWSDRRKGNAEVRAVANAHIKELEAQERNLHMMIATLRGLVKSCHGSRRDHCPILADLGGNVGYDGAPALAELRAASAIAAGWPSTVRIRASE